MKNYLIKTSVAMLVISSGIFSNACNESPKEELKNTTEPTEKVEKKVDKTRFPNDRSELAILMRDLYEDLKANKNKIANGENLDIKWSFKYAFMKKAKPTEARNSGPEFEAFVANYLTSLEAFEKATDADRIGRYNAMIQSCLSCHSDRCPGPMEAIGKLAI